MANQKTRKASSKIPAAKRKRAPQSPAWMQLAAATGLILWGICPTLVVVLAVGALIGLLLKVYREKPAMQPALQPFLQKVVRFYRTFLERRLQEARTMQRTLSPASA
jgi:hypothetical protein